MAIDVKVPQLGENIEEAEVGGLLVAVGDEVAKEDPLLELVSEKATVELPAPVAGTIAEIFVSQGEQVAIGDVVMLMEEAAVGEARAQGTEKEKSPQAVEAVEAVKEETGKEKSSTQKEPEQAEKKEKPGEGETKQKEAFSEQEISDNKEGPAPTGSQVGESRMPAPATPVVRRFARELGVDLDSIAGSGSYGRITMDDVKAYVHEFMTSSGAARPPSGSGTGESDAWGEVSTSSLSPIRRRIGEVMQASWQEIPHVTHFEKADITELHERRREWNRQVDKSGKGTKLTMTTILIKVVAKALRLHPRFNALLDSENRRIVYKQYVNLGIATATENGLLVPVIKDIQEKSLADIGGELAELVEAARSGSIPGEAMQGGSFSISNLGQLGTTHFTPVIKPPESGVLGVGQSESRLILNGGEVRERMMLPLSLSYDHRLNDGADAAKFLHTLASFLADPWELFFLE